jgi:hypothetical protein
MRYPAGAGENPGKTLVESASAYLRYAPAGNSKCFPGLSPGPRRHLMGCGSCARERIGGIVIRTEGEREEGRRKEAANNFPVFLRSKNPGSKNGMKAITLDQQDICFHFFGVCTKRKLRKAKNGMDGRQDVCASDFLGFCFAKNLSLKMAGCCCFRPAWMSAVSISWGFRCAKTPGPKNGRRPLL